MATLAAVCGTALRPVHAQNGPSPAPATGPAGAGVLLNTPADLLKLLTNPDAPQAERDEAARRLVVMNTPEAEDALQKVLINTSNPRGQQSAARALAEDPTPNPDFVDPLFTLIGPDVVSTEAAARALAHLRDTSYARLRLLDAAANRQLREPSRVAVLRSLAPLADKRTAQTLVEIVVNDAGELRSARNAAANELVEMTGLAENGADPQRWRQWWNANQAKDDAVFAQEMLAARAVRLDRVEARFDRLTEEVRQHLRENFQEATTNRERVLLGYMRSPASDVRRIGAELVVDLFQARRPIPESATQQLRTMVGDSDEQVRLQTAAAIREINDKGALDAVLVQLEGERVPAVRAALAAALAPMGSPLAVKPLLALLNDPNPMVMQAAAESLRGLKERLGEGDPKLASEISRALNDALRRAASGADAARLREELVGAMVAWASPEPDIRETFRGLLKLNETPAMRQRALQYFGQMGSDYAWPADNIINSGALEDRDPNVRRAAVNALARTAKAEHAQRLFERLSPAVEPVPAVRDEAWMALAVLFPREFEIDQLNAWADKFVDVPERRLTILETLRNKLLDARRESDLAVVRQNIGETYAKLGQHARAAIEFEEALKVPRPGQVRDLLVKQLIDAYLRSGNYENATRFGSRMIAENKQYMATIRPAITAEVDRLASAGEVENALRLIGLALKMDPPLAENVREELRAIEARLRQSATAPAAS